MSSFTHVSVIRVACVSVEFCYARVYTTCTAYTSIFFPPYTCSQNPIHDYTEYKAICVLRSSSSSSGNNEKRRKRRKEEKKICIVKRQLSTTRNKFANNKYSIIYQRRVSITYRLSIYIIPSTHIIHIYLPLSLTHCFHFAFIFYSFHMKFAHTHK